MNQGGENGPANWQLRQQYIRNEIELQRRAERSANTLCIISVVCGILALIVFLMFINIPLALCSVICGAFGLRVRCQNRKLAYVGILASVLSVVLFIVGWSIVGANVPTKDLKDGSWQKILEQEQQGESGTI